MLRDHRPRHNLAGVSHEVFQEREFFLRQIDPPIASFDHTCHRVEREVGDGQGQERGGLSPAEQRIVVVENHGGGGGVVGTAKAAEAAPDGRTVLMATLGSHVLSPATKDPRSIPYDPVTAFEPVMLVGSVPSLLVARPSLPAGVTLRELLALAKRAEAEKKPLNYGSAGSGSTMNVAMELLKSAAGVEITHIQYRGAGPAIVDLLGNHLDMLVADVNVLAPRLASGLRPVALLGPERSPLAKDVPTTAELGLPSVVMENWYGMLVPKDVPAPVRAALERDFLQAMQAPQTVERLSPFGLRNSGNAAQFRARLEKDQQQWGALIRKLGIKGE